MSNLNQTIINLPDSMNLTEQKKVALVDMSPFSHKIRSTNASYNPRDMIRINIPTGGGSGGGNGAKLHGSDSYFSFDFTPTFTIGGGIMSLDGCGYSFFKNARLINGSNNISTLRNANRAWNMLYDVSVNSSDRESDTNTMGLYNYTTVSRSNNMYGKSLVSGETYNISFCLPMPLVGSLTDKSVPLSWLNAPLVLELDLEDANRVFTSRGGKDAYAGSGGGGDVTTVISSYTITNAIYHAQISQIGPVYDKMLMDALGGNIVIPSIDYAGDEKYVAAGGTSLNELMPFSYSSVKSIFWYLTNTHTATGTIGTASIGTQYNYMSAITQRSCGPLLDYNITINGNSYPSAPILAGPSAVSTLVNNVNTYQELLKCFNLTSSVKRGGILHENVYSNNTTTAASDAVTKRFIGAISLDRGSMDNDHVYQGTSTINQQLTLNATFSGSIGAEAQHLYVFTMFDCGFVIQDGLMSVSR
jgi:hypothetical protein